MRIVLISFALLFALCLKFEFGKCEKYRAYF